MNLLEPWVLLRVAAGLVAFLLFFRGALTARKVLARFDVARANEGQLALERQIELASTFVRVGAIVQASTLAFSALAADRLSRGVRGAMCAYGVFSANDWGFRSLALTAFVAVFAGVVAQVYAFDARVRKLDLARPLAALTVLMAPLAAVDLLFASEFLLKLDLTAVASCCSVQLDAVTATGEDFAHGPRIPATIAAVVAIVAAIGSALAAARSPSRTRIAAAGLVSLVALPPVLAASVLEVAPHAFEIPHHVCPFCLLRADVYAMGYPLYGAIYLAVVWGLGAAVSAFLARGSASPVLGTFATHALRRGAMAWAFALVVGAAPIVRYFVVSGGASLFAGR